MKSILHINKVHYSRTLFVLVVLLGWSLFSKSQNYDRSQSYSVLNGELFGADTIKFGCESNPTVNEYISFEFTNSGGVDINQFSINSRIEGTDLSSDIIDSVYNSNLVSGETNTYYLGPFNLRLPGIYNISIALTEIGSVQGSIAQDDSINVVVQVLEKVSISNPIDDVEKS